MGSASRWKSNLVGLACRSITAAAAAAASLATDRTRSHRSSLPCLIERYGHIDGLLSEVAHAEQPPACLSAAAARHIIIAIVIVSSTPTGGVESAKFGAVLVTGADAR